MKPDNDEYWVTAQGNRIAIGDMTEEHAKNVLRWLIRNDMIGKHYNCELISPDHDLMPADGKPEFWKF